MAMKNKKVLAVSIGAVLAASFLIPAFMNAQAQVSSESRVLNTILALTEDINKKAQLLNNNLDNIEDDLLLKQKFWQTPPFECIVEPFNNATGSFVFLNCDGFPEPETVGFEGVESERFFFGVGPLLNDCGFSDSSACEFNVESAQIRSEPNRRIGLITTGRVITDVTGKQIETPTNLMVDMGVGKVGAVGAFVPHVELFPDDQVLIDFHEFNGEKPQGMFLGGIIFIIFEVVEEVETGALTASQNTRLTSCFNLQGEQIGCPAGL
jgi:hypothetical protein